MMDREKVIKGLECCLGANDCDIEPKEDCPYSGMCLCAMALRLDVLKLLDKPDDCENCAIAIEDRQPVVRCKDCKYYDYFNGCMSWHDVNSGNDNWYCADGERRTDDA